MSFEGSRIRFSV